MDKKPIGTITAMFYKKQGIGCRLDQSDQAIWFYFDIGDLKKDWDIIKSSRINDKPSKPDKCELVSRYVLKGEYGDDSVDAPSNLRNQLQGVSGLVD